MTADIDLTVPLPGRHALRKNLLNLDFRLFETAATRHWPGAERVLPRLSRSANHGVLWMATAAALAATGSPRARRAAVRGLASLAVASATINTVGKRSVRRPRPVLDPVPLVRQLKRQPITTSFPSGHAASAAAFATGVALESRGLGAVVAPVAFSVAMSRVYTGVHFPVTSWRARSWARAPRSPYGGWCRPATGPRPRARRTRRLLRCRTARG